MYTMKEQKNKRNLIKSSLLERIQDWPPDTQLPTEKELCKEFQVARMTVNKALSELVSEKFLYRVQGRGTFVGCRPGGKKTIYFIDNRSNWNAKPLADSQIIFMKLQNLAYSENINVELLDVDAKRKEVFDSNAIARLSLKDQVFLSFSHLHIPEMYKLLVERKCQVTYMCHDTETHEVFDSFRESWHTLYYDRISSIKNAIKFLASKGRKKIAMLSYVCHEAHPYIKGYKEGIAENGLDLEPNLIHSTPNTVADAFMFCKNLLLLRKIYDFDALIAPHDHIAAGAQQALAGAGVSCPDDVALLSMQDSKILEDSVFPVSAVAMPEDQMLKRAVEIFASDSCKSGKLETFTGKIIERSTT